MKRSEIWMWASTCAAGALAACGGGEDRCDPDAPDTICTIAGAGEPSGLDDRPPPADGPALQEMLYGPMDITLSPEGELWILDSFHYLVRVLDRRGALRTVLGNGMVGDSPPAGVDRVPALEALFNHTTDLAFHEDQLYLAARFNGRIKRVRLSDMTLENFAGRGVRTYFDGDGGPALEAAFDLPTAIAIAPTGEIAVMDVQNQVIRQVGRDGVVRTIAGRCIIDLGEPCEAGEQPVSCPGSHKTTCGDLTSCGAPCSPGFAGDGGPALEARMAQPIGGPTDPSGHLAYDSAGNLLFADSDNHRIRKIDTAGVITTVAGTGVRGQAGDGGPAIAAQLNYPVDLAVAPDGTIYFTDTRNSCIRKVDPTGAIHRVAGQCSDVPADRGFAGDGGPPLEALLDRPFGLHLAGHKLYVADSFNHRIRVVNLPR